MKRTAQLTLAFAIILTTATAFASDADTSATAARAGRNTAAAATAHYDGAIGFAQTNTESGDLTRARGVAVGVDRDGLTLSVSNAFASRDGLGLATNFNISIDRDGHVSRSGGVALADSPYERSVTASGSATNDRRTEPALSYASAHTDTNGRAEARTWADSDRSGRATYRPAEYRPAEYRVATPVTVYPEYRVTTGRRVVHTKTVRRVESARVIRTVQPEVIRYRHASR